MVAAGFNISCDKSRVKQLFVPGTVIRVPPVIWDSNPYSQATLFQVDVSYTGLTFNESDVLSPTYFNVTVIHRDQEDKPWLKTTLARHTCTFQSAIVEYDLRIVNGTVSLLSLSSLSDNRTRELVQDHFETWYPTIYDGLAGFAMAIQDLYTGNALLGNTAAADEDRVLTITGANTRNYALRRIATGRNPKAEIELTFADPMPEIIDTLRQLSFRDAMVNKTITNEADYWEQDYRNVMVEEWGDSRYFPFRKDWINRHKGNMSMVEAADAIFGLSQVVNATQTSVVTVYKSQYHYFAAALIPMLVTTTSILPTFYGWWQLGRPMTLSPIEIAKAFDSKILKEAESNSTVEGTLEVLGHRKIQYGALLDDIKTSPLRLDPSILDNHENSMKSGGTHPSQGSEGQIKEGTTLTTQEEQQTNLIKLTMSDPARSVCPAEVKLSHDQSVNLEETCNVTYKQTAQCEMYGLSLHYFLSTPEHHSQNRLIFDPHDINVRPSIEKYPYCVRSSCTCRGEERCAIGELISVLGVHLCTLGDEVAKYIGLAYLRTQLYRELFRLRHHPRTWR